MADSLNDTVECAVAVGLTWTFLDGECTPAMYARLCRHLEGCRGCLDHYALEGRVKNLIATKGGGEKAPKRINWCP